MYIFTDLKLCIGNEINHFFQNRVKLIVKIRKNLESLKKRRGV